MFESTPRTEHSRSLADAERFRALETLTELGMLIPMDQTGTYHGRVRWEGEAQWGVDATYANGGRGNVNARSTLYVGEYDVAWEFADQRFEGARHSAETAASSAIEIHDIVSFDPDARIIDLEFDETRLADDDLARYTNAARALVLTMTQGSPLSFEHAHSMPIFRSTLERGDYPLITEAQLTDFIQSGLDPAVALQLAGSYNAARAAHIKPGYLFDNLLRNAGNYAIAESNGIGTAPFNLEYVLSYARAAHIVGCRSKVLSAALQRPVHTTALFDLEQIGTTAQRTARIDQSFKRMGRLAADMKPLINDETLPDYSVLQVLKNAYATPRQIVEAAKAVEGYGPLLEASAGNRAGYTLEQHIETVLRNFDANYADKVPVPMIEVMRTIILSHDIGKSVAAAHDDKDNQRLYNEAYAADFLHRIGVDERMRDVVIAIIGEGEELAYKRFIERTDQSAGPALQAFAHKTLARFYGYDAVRPDQIASFIDMCYMLQVCDGGAYTSMATTRVAGLGVIRNYPSYNGTFAMPPDALRRQLRIRSSHEVSAPDDLAPKYQ